MTKASKRRLVRAGAGVALFGAAGALVGHGVGQFVGGQQLAKRFNTRALKTINSVRTRPRPMTLGESLRRSFRENLDIGGMLSGNERSYGQRLFEDRYLKSGAAKRFMARTGRRGAAIGAGVGTATGATVAGIGAAVSHGRRRRA